MGGPNFGFRLCLHIGISTGYPPYYFLDKEQNPSGICIDIISHVAKQLKIEVYYSSFPWKRMIYSGKEGVVDAVMPLFRTEERDKFLLFPQSSLIEEDNSFFILKNSGPSYSGNLNDVVDYHIGVIDGYSYGQEFDTRKDIQHKVISKGEEQLIQLVVNQRVDMGIGNSMVITYLAAQQNLAEKITFLTPPVVENPLYIGFSKANVSSAFVSRFNQALRDFKATDTYQEIIKKHTDAGKQQ